MRLGRHSTKKIGFAVKLFNTFLKILQISQKWLETAMRAYYLGKH